MLTGVAHVEILDSEFDQVSGNAIFVNKQEGGVAFLGLRPRSAAAGVGFRNGDFIQKVGGRQVEGISWFRARQTHTKLLVCQGLALSSRGSNRQLGGASQCCACHLAA